MRRIVISFMTSVTLSSGEQTETAFVINSEIGIVGNLPLSRGIARPHDEMPNFVFSDYDIDMIVAYINSLSPPK
jgi:hypothetical protein